MLRTVPAQLEERWCILILFVEIHQRKYWKTNKLNDKSLILTTRLGLKEEPWWDWSRTFLLLIPTSPPWGFEVGERVWSWFTGKPRNIWPLPCLCVYLPSLVSACFTCPGVFCSFFSESWSWLLIQHFQKKKKKNEMEKKKKNKHWNNMTSFLSFKVQVLERVVCRSAQLSWRRGHDCSPKSDVHFFFN